MRNPASSIQRIKRRTNKTELNVETLRAKIKCLMEKSMVLEQAIYKSEPDAKLMITNMNCPYEILGVPRNANDAQIKAAFRNLAKKYHPDANDPSSDLHFKEIINPSKKKDAKLR